MSQIEIGQLNKRNEPGGGDGKPPSSLFLNRELSWLQFNQRVLHEALDERTPLLERVRFLSIFTSNLDEFYMKRVGGLKRQVEANVVKRGPQGRTASQQLQAIRDAVLPMLRSQADCYQSIILPALAEVGVGLLGWAELNDEERHHATRFFKDRVFPVLTPLAVDPGHPFPFISNLSLSLGVLLRYPDTGVRLFARVKIPHSLPQWVRVGGEPAAGDQRYISLLDLIQNNLEHLFPGMQVMRAMAFRITRNADVERDEEDADDLLEMIEQELRQRRFENVVRMEFAADPDPWIRRYLMSELELTADDVYEMHGLMDYTCLNQIADLPLPQLKFEHWTPALPPTLADDDTDIFSTIRTGDQLVHHPYESFNASVERFISAAADDPKVLAIKMAVYRTGDDSPVIRTLIRAAEAGKQVVCLVELKARFDEARNVQLAQMLEDAGVHVVYGLVGYKTHTKIALIVRDEGQSLRCYVHIGTGNYHTGTAKLYTDLGLFTCNPAITDDVAQLFNYLTGRSLKDDYNRLLVAPVTMERRFIEMIDREAEHAREGRPAQIIAKMNGFEHREISQALCRASAAGVSIDLIVRGYCCLRPGVEGQTENIRVISVIGRFLEHSRVFYFRDGAEDPLDGRFFMGSADWMHRNLRARVEATTPIEVKALRERCWQLLQVMLHDRRQAWDMHADGSYTQRRPDTDESNPDNLGTHIAMMHLTRLQSGGQHIDALAG